MRAKSPPSKGFSAPRRRFFEYLLGHFSQKYGIAIHAFVAMSNHYHLVVTDTEGRLPDFERDFNSMVARALNWHWKRWEAFWDRESYSAVKLLEEQDVISKIGYVLANPVKARLVGRAREWEGATSAGMGFGWRRRIQRPDKFFRESMPEEVELVLTRPAGFEGLSDREVLELVRAEVGRREVLHRKQGMARKMREVFEQEWWECPESFDPRRKLRPTVAGKNKWARIEALQRAGEWLADYYEALRRFVGGEREVVFPRGTWHMGVRLGCPVGAASS
ncbi:MAG: hypothetical protein R6X02_21355 [Enhygromyxa sp.]